MDSQAILGAPPSWFEGGSWGSFLFPSAATFTVREGLGLGGCVAPTALTIVALAYPGLTPWANVFRAYGAGIFVGRVSQENAAWRGAGLQFVAACGCKSGGTPPHSKLVAGV